MKNIHQLLLLAALSLVLILCVPVVNAQEPPHPPTTGHGVNGNQTPGNASAPIDGGLGILLAFGLAYGMKKASAKTNEPDTE